MMAYEPAARYDPVSNLRLAAETISAGIGRKLSGRPSDARMAAELPTFLDQIHAHFPACYEWETMLPRHTLDDLECRMAFVYGTQQERIRTLLERISCVGRVAPTLGSLLALCPSDALKLSGMQQVVSSFLPSRTREQMHLVLPELEGELLLRAPNITAELTLNPQTSLTDLLKALTRVQRNLTSTPAAGDHAAESQSSASDTRLSSARNLSGDSLREATQGSTEFQSVFIEIKALDLALFADQMEALALAFNYSNCAQH